MLQEETRQQNKKSFLAKDLEIIGTIFAKNIKIDCKINGNIEAENIEILNNANIIGEISYKQTLSIKDGATLNIKTKAVPTIE